MFITMWKCAVFFFINLIPIFLALSDEMQELAEMLHNQCREETGTSEELILKCRKGEFTEDDNLKCYMKCLMDQMACVSDDGIVDEEAVLAVLPEEYHEIAAPILKACGTKIGENPCDNIFLTNKCWYSHNPQEYYLV